MSILEITFTSHEMNESELQLRLWQSLRSLASLSWPFGQLKGSLDPNLFVALKIFEKEN